MFADIFQIEYPHFSGAAIGPAVDVLIEAIANGAKEHAGETYVRVTNSMGPDVEITANCASADDAVDETKLKDKESFAFSFDPNVFQTTEFWCDISSSDGYTFAFSH